MPRWNNNLESNCKDILDNFIKNVKPTLYQILLQEVLDATIENKKKTIEKFIRNRLNLVSSLSKHTKGYWSARGWNDNESYSKAKEHKQKNCKSIYSREFWVEKINPESGINYTVLEADFERNSRRPIRKEYWVAKGYSEEEAVNLAINAKNVNNIKGAMKSAQSVVRKVSSKRCHLITL